MTQVTKITAASTIFLDQKSNFFTKKNSEQSKKEIHDFENLFKTFAGEKYQKRLFRIF